ncbi:signal peptide peptidase SppA [Spirochaetota bacterium]
MSKKLHPFLFFLICIFILTAVPLYTDTNDAHFIEENYFEPVSDPQSVISRILFPAGITDIDNSAIAYSRYYDTRYISDYSLSFILGNLGFNFFHVNNYQGGTFSLSLPVDRGLSFGYRYSSINSQSLHYFSYLQRIYRFLSYGLAFNRIGTDDFSFQGGLSIKPYIDFLTLSYQYNAFSTQREHNVFLRMDIFKTAFINIHYDFNDLNVLMGINLWGIGISSMLPVRFNSESGYIEDLDTRKDTISLNSKTKKGIPSFSKYYILLRLAGTIDGLIGGVSFDGNYQPSLLDLSAIVERIIRDRTVKGVIIRLDYLNIGYGMAEEIRNLILRLRDHNKRVYIWAKTMGQKEYFIASAAHKVYISKMGIIGLKGIGVNFIFLKNMFDKVGLEFDVVSMGKYKSAGEALVRTNFSPEAMEQESTIYSNYYNEIFSKIIHERNLEITKEELVDKGPYNADEAFDHKLIDGVEYYNDFIEKVKSSLFVRITDPAYLFSTAYDNWWDGMYDKVIALVEVNGDIITGKSGNGLFNSRGFSGDEDVVNLLYKSANFPSTKAIVLRINSPGGSTLASDLIWHAVADISSREKKPVPIIASMGDVAASGGYYIVTHCKRIFAMPLTITGSIGVFYYKPTVSKLFEKIGITTSPLTMGKHSHHDSILYKYTEEDKEEIAGKLKTIYENFLDIVYEGRSKNIPHITPKEVAQMSEGRVYTGKHASQIGLVDSIGGLADAIMYTKKLCNIKGDNYYYRIYARTRGIDLAYFFDGMRSFYKNVFNIFYKKETYRNTGTMRIIRLPGKGGSRDILGGDYLKYLSSNISRYLTIFNSYQYRLDYEIIYE